MRSTDLVFIALAGLGVTFLAARYMGVQQDVAEEMATFEDTPGPNLVIEVGGGTSGMIVVDLLPNVAPNHVERVITLTNDGAYDGVAFHRVIDGFMAQTGDVSHGRIDGDLSGAGTGGSDLPDLEAEFSNVPYSRGTVGMARAVSPDSGNSQFFIMFAPEPDLNGEYTVFGRVIEGMDVVDTLRRGEGGNGRVSEPDYMVSVQVIDDEPASRPATSE